VIGVEQWAEIRRMHRVERLSIREIGRRTVCIGRRAAGTCRVDYGQNCGHFRPFVVTRGRVRPRPRTSQGCPKRYICR
jgi:hypothetical protein